MNIRACLLSGFYFWSVAKGINSTSKRVADDDYYLNYDYEISNDSSNSAQKPVSFLLPNPETINSRYTVDILPNVELPDDSLSDSDLKDHDFIDNLMYVYYGSHNKNGDSSGSEAVIIGSVLSCAAQLFTIFALLLKRNLNGKREVRNLFLHLLISLCSSTLLFMLGVHAVQNHFKCLLISLGLHYLNLLSAFWIFLYCSYVSSRLTLNGTVLKSRYLLLVGYGVPLILSASSYLITPNSFETKRFCFLSVQKGMIINYMVPVSLLILLTTFYALNGIRNINVELSKLELDVSAETLNTLRNEFIDKRQEPQDEEVVSLRTSKVCLKLLCFLQTAYNIVWFMAVVALENSDNSSGMAIIYSVSSCLLNWFVFFKVEAFLPNVFTISLSNVVPDEAHKSNERNDDFTVAGKGSSDSIPLLVSAENSREIRLEYISTISN